MHDKTNLKKTEIHITPQILREWFACEMGRLGVPDRYVDAFCGRVPRSVLAKHHRSIADMTGNTCELEKSTNVYVSHKIDVGDGNIAMKSKERKGMSYKVARSLRGIGKTLMAIVMRYGLALITFVFGMGIAFLLLFLMGVSVTYIPLSQLVTTLVTLFVTIVISVVTSISVVSKIYMKAKRKSVPEKLVGNG